MRLPLAATVAALADSLGAGRSGARVRSATIDVPLEVALATDDSGSIEILANLPRWRWTTDFDSRPGRVYVTFVANEDER